MLSLIQGLEDDRRLMKAASSEIKKRGKEYAEAEADYQATKARVALEMKANGYPVTFIQTIIKGNKEVNDKLFKRDCAEAEYRSAMEALNVYKLDSRLLEAQIAREWSSQNSI